MNLKRFVTYIYQYDQGKRGKNAGFIKADIRDSGCRLELSVGGLDRFQGRAQIYLILPGENAPAFFAGELPVGPGGGRTKLFYNRSVLGDSGYTADQIQAVAIRCGGGKLLLSCWTDDVPEAVLRGQFAVEGKDDSPKSETAPLHKEETSTEEAPSMETETTAGTESEIKAEVETEQTAEIQMEMLQPEEIPAPRVAVNDWENTSPLHKEEMDTEVSPSTPETSQDGKVAPTSETSQDETTPPSQIAYEKIEITDIRKFPQRNWHLCNNSFLIHGFFNYHYLILKTVEEKGEKACWLGVPGIYEQPERMMALLFGFPEFEAARINDENAAQNAPTPGVFGYWMCQLEL